ncbi:hypothetical protein LCGC14_0863090 [marine sediment metagenome]|uniref:Uncharacterized protein n=1 Tax=marine sediment metagenome TaxID=412755 RepID=A0A0F9RRG6_9ZZZZ
MAQTIDNLLAEIRRKRELAGDIRPTDLSDLLTRLTIGGTRQEDTGGFSLEDLLGLGFGDGGGGGGGRGGGGAAFGGTRAGAELGQLQLLEQLGLEQGFEAGESALDRALRLTLLGKEQGFEAGESGLDRALRQALLATEQKFTGEQSLLGREFEAAESEKGREFTRAQELAKRKDERLRIFSEMRGTDPVRAVLFAMGIGGEGGVGGRFEDLPPIEGARTLGTQTEAGLEALLGGKIRIGQGGVTGLQSPVKAAAAFSAGQGVRGGVGALKDARTLLTSAFGVGAEKGKGRPGMSRDEILRQIKSVTPAGVI